MGSRAKPNTARSMATVRRLSQPKAVTEAQKVEQKRIDTSFETGSALAQHLLRRGPGDEARRTKASEEHARIAELQRFGAQSKLNQSIRESLAEQEKAKVKAVTKKKTTKKKTKTKTKVKVVKPKDEDISGDEGGSRGDYTSTQESQQIAAASKARVDESKELTEAEKRRRARLKNPRKYGRLSLISGSELGVRDSLLGA